MPGLSHISRQNEVVRCLHIYVEQWFYVEPWFYVVHGSCWKYLEGL